MLTLKIVKGKTVGFIPADKYSQEWAEKREGLEFVAYPNDKQAPYLRGKYWAFLDCCMNLPDYVLYDILKGKEFDSIEKQKDYFRKKILVACSYTEPVLVIEGDDLVWRDLPKRTSKMGDIEFAKMYADMREAVFAICFKSRIRIVNGVEQIVRMTDFDMFEIFKALYLGFEMKHIAEVERQLGFMDVSFHSGYLRLCKLNNAPASVEQFNKTQK